MSALGLHSNIRVGLNPFLVTTLSQHKTGLSHLLMAPVRNFFAFAVHPLASQPFSADIPQDLFDLFQLRSAP